MKIIEGWVAGVQQLPSPNYNARPTGEISLLVIHNISLPMGEFGNNNVEALFRNCLDCRSHPTFSSLENAELSSHFYIKRDGALIQFVSCEDRAWHAGVSVYEERGDCNDFSLGIELQGTDDQPFTANQYESLIRLTSALLTHYPLITPQRIVGHEHIAPNRKTDPGPFFEWNRYLKEIK